MREMSKTGLEAKGSNPYSSSPNGANDHGHLAPTTEPGDSASTTEVPAAPRLGVQGGTPVQGPIPVHPEGDPRWRNTRCNACRLWMGPCFTCWTADVAHVAHVRSPAAVPPVPAPRAESEQGEPCGTCRRPVDLTKTLVMLPDGSSHHPVCYVLELRAHRPGAIGSRTWQHRSSNPEVMPYWCVEVLLEGIVRYQGIGFRTEVDARDAGRWYVSCLTDQRELPFPLPTGAPSLLRDQMIAVNWDGDPQEAAALCRMPEAVRDRVQFLIRQREERWGGFDEAGEIPLALMNLKGLEDEFLCELFAAFDGGAR